ncbi:hypothetical protein [Sphingobium sp. TomMM35A]
MSIAIAQLEQSIGGTLMERSRAGIALTAEERILLVVLRR